MNQKRAGRRYREEAGEWHGGGRPREHDAALPALASRHDDTSAATRLARGLGWFSISLGVVEVLAPRFVSRLVGGRGNNAALIRLYGMREIVSGMMIFGQGERPAAGMWSRVAGDAIDIATLAATAASPATRKGALAVATANVLGVTALDVYCAQQLSRSGTAGSSSAIRMSRSVVVNRSPEELYAFWHDFENLPRFMQHLQSVRVTGPRTSHWMTNGPAGTSVEWDAEMTADTPNELIAWRSTENADVDNSGIVQFERRPQGRGTVVRVEIEYRPPGGRAGALVARLFNESPEQQIYDDLHRMKQVIETGEVVRSDAVPEGMGPIMQEPAQPAKRDTQAMEATR